MFSTLMQDNDIDCVCVWFSQQQWSIFNLIPVHQFSIVKLWKTRWMELTKWWVIQLANLTRFWKKSKLAHFQRANSVEYALVGLLLVKCVLSLLAWKLSPIFIASLIRCYGHSVFSIKSTQKRKPTTRCVLSKAG